MKKILEILNNIRASGLIEDYAIAGGIATIYYIESYIKKCRKHLR